MSPSTIRTRTPSELKWLLNERAALHGRASAYVELQGQLSARVTRLDAQLRTLRTALSDCTKAIADARSVAAALDVTMELGFPQVNPAAAGEIRPQVRYGERGALTDFVQEHLRLLSPRGFTAAELRKEIARQFGLVLLTSQEKDIFRSTVSATLRQIRDRHGTIEAVSTGVRSQSRWRWKQAATLDDLRRMSERSSMSEEDPPHERAPHPNTI